MAARHGRHAPGARSAARRAALDGTLVRPRPHRRGEISTNRSWPYPPLFAHRGGGTLAPENTLAAIGAAARYGYAAVEFDAKLSADGVPFLLHDDTLERTTNSAGPAAVLPYARLAQLDAGSWYGEAFAGEPLPTLVAACERCAALGIIPNVEIKPSPGTEAETGERVAQTVRDFAVDGTPPLLSSFSPVALDAARNAAPELPRGLLAGSLPGDWENECARMGCSSIHLSVRGLKRRAVEMLRAAGLFVFTYTVNDAAQARELFSWGVDAICTDRIDLVSEQAR